MNKPFRFPSGDLLVDSASLGLVEHMISELARSDFAPEVTQKGNEAASVGSDFWRPDLSYVRPYRVEGGVLTIPVQGVLLNKFPFQFGGWATGYEYVTEAVRRGRADPEVEKIVLDVDSPGGLVAGCFDCSDAIYEARGAKPILAVVNESAYSAAYALASAADRIAVARTGGVGSIGVITAHMDVSGALEQRGIKVSLIYRGQHKPDGHPSIPLSDAARAQMQARTDMIYEMFVSLVARNRGMAEQAVRDTEAATFMAREAIEIGLADSVGGLDSLSVYADPSEDEEDYEMSKNDASTVAQAVTPEAPAVAQAVTPDALATVKAEAHAQGIAAGRSAERERVAAILDCEEAVGRTGLARYFALNTEMDPEAAKAALAAAPKESAVAPAEGPSEFEVAMEAGAHPELGADGGAQMSEDEAFLAQYRSLLGR